MLHKSVSAYQNTIIMKLKIENLNFFYKKNQILKDISLQVGKGELVSILGPSGCGKSTLLNIVAGLLPAGDAKIYVDGKQISGISKHFAYMPQDDLLLPWNKVIDNVCLYGKINGGFEAAKSEAVELLKEFGLEGYGEKYPHTLSGGMRQRAAFLRTAMCPADILLLDEPFGALDVISRGNMQDWLLEVRKKIDRTMVLVTHDMDEAIYLSDRIMVMAGKPSGFIKEIAVTDKDRSREWLFAQNSIRQEIYESMRERVL